MSLLAGVRYPLRGARFVFVEHRELARIWLVPIGLTLVALVGAVWGAVELHGPLLDSLFQAPSGGGALATAARWLHGLLAGVLLVVLVLMGGVLVLALAQVFAAPFNDALSERVEELAGGRAGPPFSWGGLLRDVVRTVKLELAKFGVWAAVMLPLFVLSLLVPGVGQLFYSIFGFIFTALYFALDYIDWPASRREQGAGYRWALLRAHPGMLLGFGVGVWFLLVLPVVNLLFMPAAVAGGTLLYLDLERHESEEADL